MLPKYQALPPNALFNGCKQIEDTTRSCTVLKMGFLLDPKDMSNKPSQADNNCL